MKKRDFFLASALALGVSVGITSYAGMLSNVAPLADETTEETTDPEEQVEYKFAPLKSSFPANDQAIPSYQVLSEIYVDFSINADDPGTINEGDFSIVILKDGVPYETISAASGQIARDRLYTHRFNVKLATPIKEEGNYTIEVPQGMFTLGHNLDSNTYYMNDAATVNFKVEAQVEYSVFPAQNSNVLKNALAHVTITYPEGSVVTINPNATGVAVLNNNNPSVEADGNPITPLTEYTITGNGNVVTLTAKDPSAIKVTNNTIDRLWDEIQIAGNLWTITKDGKDYVNPEMTLGKYGVIAVSADIFTTTPALNSAEAIPAADMFELKLHSEVALEPAKVLGATTIANLKVPNGTSSKNVITYRLKEISEDGKTITLEAGAKGTTGTNNPDMMISYDKYFLELNQNIFKTVVGEGEESETLPKLTLSNFNIKGTDALTPYSTSPVSGEATTGFKIATITLNYFCYVEVANPDAVAELRRGNEVVASWKMSEIAKPTYAVKFTANPAITDKGTYVFHLPAGAIKSTLAGTLNAEYNVNINNNDAFPISSITPLSWDPETNNVETESISEVTFEYPEGYTIQLKPTANLTNLQLAKTLKSNFGKTNAGSGSVNNPSVEIDGNKITFRFTPVTEAQAEDRVYNFRVPKNFFIVTSPNGESAPNDIIVAWYAINNPKPGFIEQTEVETGADLNTINYTSSQAVYDFDTKKSYDLTNAAGDVVASYSVAKDFDKDIEAGTKYVFTVKDASKLADLPSGEYTFTIPTESMRMGGNKDVSQSFLCKTPFIYPISITGISSGVEEVGEEVALDIYSIDGRIIALGANREVINTLDAGVYVINGKKVVVRK